MIWIIIGIILLILLILLFSSIIIAFDYSNGKSYVRLKYLFINRDLTKQTNKKKSDKVRKDRRKKNKSEKIKKDGEKSSKSKKHKIIPEDFSGKVEFFKNILSSAGKAFRRITGHIKITNIYLDFIISDPDAYECAIKFGKANIIVYNAISYLGNFVKLKKKSINIHCLYNQPESKYNLKFDLHISPAVLIMSLTAFIFAFRVNISKEKDK